MPKVTKSEKLLTQEIIKASDAVRKKFYALKTGQADEDAAIEKTLKPLVDPLKVIAATAGSTPRLKDEPAPVFKTKPADDTNTVNESMAWDFESELPESQNSPYRIAKRRTPPPMLKRFLQRRLTLGRSTPHHSQNTEPSSPPPPPSPLDNNDDDDDDDDVADNDEDDDDNVFDAVYETPDPVTQSKSPRSMLMESITEPQDRQTLENQFEENFGTLTKNYIMESITDTRNKMDTQYGIRHVANGFMIGDSPVTFEYGHIHVNGVRFKTTEGLLELLFKKIPDDSLYTDRDLIKYGKIVESSNAHKRGYLKSNQICGNRSYKYTEIIQKLFMPKQRPFFHHHRVKD